MPPISEHEQYLTANAEARARMESGKPWRPEPRYPPPLRVEFDREVSHDAVLHCPNCDSAILRIVQRFSDDDGQSGTLLQCGRCSSAFGVILMTAETREGAPVVLVAVRAVGA